MKERIVENPRWSDERKNEGSGHRRAGGRQRGGGGVREGAWKFANRRSAKDKGWGSSGKKGWWEKAQGRDRRGRKGRVRAGSKGMRKFGRGTSVGGKLATSKARKDEERNHREGIEEGDGKEGEKCGDRQAPREEVAGGQGRKKG